MKKLLYLLFLLSATAGYAQSDQDYWDTWNKNYPEVDIIPILKYEHQYADSVEKNPSIPPYYSRLAKYRFRVEYIGKTRMTSKDVVSSMKHVFKLFAGNPDQLDALSEQEVLVKIGQDEVWMPVQPQILQAMKEEVQQGDQIILYCMYFNEHTSKNVLYNTFLISEFYK